MPDDWQMRMAELLEEWDETWDSHDMPNPMVVAHNGKKFARWPEWLLNYRHPQKDEIDKLRAAKGLIMGDVVPWGGFTKLDLPVDSMLESNKGKLECLVMIGYTPDGKEFFASSHGDNRQTLWLLERAKHHLMTMADGAD